jgi:hypothetical protein
MTKDREVEIRKLAVLGRSGTTSVPVGVVGLDLLNGVPTGIKFSTQEKRKRVGQWARLKDAISQNPPRQIDELRDDNSKLTRVDTVFIPRS